MAAFWHLAVTWRTPGAWSASHLGGSPLVQVSAACLGPLGSPRCSRYPAQQGHRPSAAVPGTSGEGRWSGLRPLPRESRRSQERSASAAGLVRHEARHRLARLSSRRAPV